MSIPEADWKKFGPLRAVALDRLCDSILKSAVEIAKNENDSNHDRYLLLFKTVRDQDRELAQIFDGYSRSKALMQLAMMASKGLISEDEIEQFSEDTQNYVRRAFPVGGV